jgi:hypothetical protein
MLRSLLVRTAKAGRAGGPALPGEPDPSRRRARLDQVAAVRRPAGRRTVSTLLRLSLALAASR